jgi:hypothetical protein
MPLQPCVMEPDSQVLTSLFSSYPNSWPAPPPMAIPQIPSSNTAYPSSTGVSIESYAKPPLSGAPTFTSEPQEMPMQPSSMPPLPMTVTTLDHQHPQHHQQQPPQQTQQLPPPPPPPQSIHQTQALPQLPQPQLSQQHQPLHGRQIPPPLRTQYGYGNGTSGPPPLSVLTAPAPDTSVSIPRYIDSNPRPLKSPRTFGHEAIHSAGSLHEAASAEYRYGSSYSGMNNSTAELSPHASHPPNYTSAAQEPVNAGQPPASNNGQSARDFYPPAPAWTSTAGETVPAVSYPQAAARPYAYPDQFKAEYSATKTEAHLPPLPAQTSTGFPSPRGSFDAVHQYSWNAT